jgi:hypothetical protein
MSTIFDETLPFDEYSRARVDIEHPSELYPYLRMALIPALFNEAFKNALITPLLRPYFVINVQTNETEHFVNCGPNYLVGVSFKRTAIKYSSNYE